MPRQPAKPEERIACCRCGKNKKETEFYKVSSSPLWTATKNRAPFCKDCIEQIYRDYSVQYGGRAAIIAVAALLDYLSLPTFTRRYAKNMVPVPSETIYVP